MQNIVRLLLYNHLFDLSRKKEKVFLTFSIRPVPKLEKSREKRLSPNWTKPSLRIRILVFVLCQSRIRQFCS